VPEPEVAGEVDTSASGVRRSRPLEPAPVAALPQPVPQPEIKRARHPSMIARPAPRVAGPVPAHAPAAQPAAKASPEDPAALMRRGRAALEGHRYDEAFKLLVRAQRLAPHDATCKALRGYLLHLRGDRGDAPETLIDEALRQDPLCERAHHYKGLLVLARHDAEQAAHHFSEAVVLDPENRQAALMYRRCRDEQRGVRGMVNAVLRAGERLKRR
jgi:Flp pilus assembly protein TadD